MGLAINIDNYASGFDISSGANAVIWPQQYNQKALRPEELPKISNRFTHSSGGTVYCFFTDKASGSDTKINVIQEPNRLSVIIDEICLAFSLNKNQLPEILKVSSKKTLYNWINGVSKPRKEAMSRLHDLFITGKNLKSSGITIKQEDLYKPVIKDQNLYQLLSKESIDSHEIIFAGSRLQLSANITRELIDPFSS